MFESVNHVNSYKKEKKVEKKVEEKVKKPEPVPEAPLESIEDVAVEKPKKKKFFGRKHA